MAFTSSLGTTLSGLSNIELGKGATPFTPPPTSTLLFVASVQNRFITAKVVQRATTQLVTVPDGFDMATTETYPYVVDVTNYLGTSDTVSSVSPVLVRMPGNVVITSAWNGSTTIQGNIITIPVNVHFLSVGQKYQVAVTFTASSSKVATYVSNFRVVA